MTAGMERKRMNEHDPISDGLDWRTEAGIKGEAKAGVSLHFVSKLYGCTGGDISFGVYGKAGGEAKVSAREDWQAMPDIWNWRSRRKWREVWW